MDSPASGCDGFDGLSLSRAVAAMVEAGGGSLRPGLARSPVGRLQPRSFAVTVGTVDQDIFPGYERMGRGSNGFGDSGYTGDFMVHMGFHTGRKFALAACTWFLSGSAALASGYSPGFPCPRPTDEDLLAVEICSDGGMARAELTYEKTYYAHRQQDGTQAYKALKIQAAAYSSIIRSNCGLPPVGSPTPMPPTSAACYVSQIAKLTDEWNRTLRGDALQEGLRGIDTHIAAQGKLIELGFLPRTARADGVYGAATRAAIMGWQRGQGVPETGFLGDSQIAALLSDASPAAMAGPLSRAGAEPVPRTSAELPVSSMDAPTFTLAASRSPAGPGVDETRFLSFVADFHRKYDAASNDFQKGAVFQQRAAALRPLLNGGTAARNWIGKVYKLSSNGDGFGVLEVTLSDDAWLTTWNNSFSDSGDHTLIPPGSPVYQALGTLSEGDEVVFSGHFLETGDRDVLHTNGLTMNSKLTEPEFLFVFTDLKKK